MTIVQIGTNNGVDSCSDYILRNKDIVKEVHLVEPLNACNEHIRRVYRDIDNVKIYNMAISDNYELKEIDIYYPAYDKISGHSSSNYGHLTAHHHHTIESVKVPCCTLEDFFTTNNIKKCDRLYIDTEGLDCSILIGFDYVKYNISYIEFEVIHADGTFRKGDNYEKCVAKFLSNGYRMSTAGEFNECAIKND